MITKEITTSVREVFGKGPIGRMRAEGKTPGVVYSGGNEALALSLRQKFCSRSCWTFRAVMPS